MRIAITSSDTNNPYAALLAIALIESGHTPVAFLINPMTPRQVIIRYAKFYGWYQTFLRILHSPIPMGTAKYILVYVSTHHLASTAKLTIAQVAGQHHIRIMRGKFGQSKIQDFAHNNVDVIINAGGGIFPVKLIKAVRLGILNIHMGHLPDFRGVHTFEWSLWYRQPLEVAAHWISAKIDEGDVLLRQRFIPHNVVSLQDLKDQSVAVRINLCLRAIRGLDEGRLSGLAQDKTAGRQYYVMHPALQAIVEKQPPYFNKN